VACSTFFQTGVARLANTSTSTDAYILCHLLLINPLFTTCKATMAESLASLAAWPRNTVARMTSEPSHVTTAAVEVLAAGIAATTPDAEGRQSRHAEGTEAQSKAHFEAFVTSLNSVASPLMGETERSGQCHLRWLFGAPTDVLL